MQYDIQGLSEDDVKAIGSNRYYKLNGSAKLKRLIKIMCAELLAVIALNYLVHEDCSWLILLVGLHGFLIMRKINQEADQAALSYVEDYRGTEDA